MGHTPSQRPSDEDPPGAQDSSGHPSAVGRFRRELASFVAGVRRKLSVFSDLDLAAAFSVEAESADAHGRPPTRTTEDNLPVQRTEETALAIPARTVPFTQPARNASEENPPDLESTEQGGHLSIYHPDHDGAEITSDTYHRVEP